MKPWLMLAAGLVFGVVTGELARRSRELEAATGEDIPEIDLSMLPQIHW